MMELKSAIIAAKIAVGDHIRYQESRAKYFDSTKYYDVK